MYSLTIENLVSKLDSGNYTCIIETANGFVTHTVCVTVSGRYGYCIILVLFVK